jgi:predicted phage tail protein
MDTQTLMLIAFAALFSAGIVVAFGGIVLLLWERRAFRDSRRADEGEPAAPEPEPAGEASP